MVQDTGFFSVTVPQPYPAEPPGTTEGATMEAAPEPDPERNLEARLSALFSDRPIWSHQMLLEKLGPVGSVDVPPPVASTSSDLKPGAKGSSIVRNSPLQQSLARLAYRFKTGKFELLVNCNV